MKTHGARKWCDHVGTSALDFASFYFLERALKCAILASYNFAWQSDRAPQLTFSSSTHYRD